MSMKTLWKKLLTTLIKQPEPELLPYFIEVIPALASPPLRARTTEEQKLFECFYGTLIDREPPTHKKKHAHDGWREGHSNPFILNGVTHDVQRNADASLDLFHALMAEMRGEG